MLSNKVEFHEFQGIQRAYTLVESVRTRTRRMFSRASSGSATRAVGTSDCSGQKQVTMSLEQTKNTETAEATDVFL